MNSSNGAVSVIDLVQRDHREIERMLDQITTKQGSDRKDAFEDLVRLLAVHETAEEEVVHPLAKRIGADSVAADVLQEEETAKETLARLDGIDVTTPEFTTEFEHFRQKVLAHAQHEEHEEHVRIRASTEPDKLESLGRRFALAEKTAPTRPHPNVPSSRGANLALGPILAVTDRVRDALRDAGGDERG